MRRVVELLFIIGILINALKAADLLLRPRQQAWLQQKLETLTLRLDYTKPLDWYKGFKNRRTKVILVIASSLLYLSLAVLILIIGRKGGAGGLRVEDGPLGWSVNSPLWLPTFTLLIIWLTWEFLDPREREHAVVKFILRGGRFRSFLWRPLLVIAMAAAINLTLLTLSVAFQLAAAYESTWAWVILIYVYIAILGMLYTFSVVVAEIEMIAMLSVIIFCLSITLLIFEAVLKVTRGIAWRIVEYNKGAYAAITLLITIALGILESYLKGK